MKTLIENLFSTEGPLLFLFSSLKMLFTNFRVCLGVSNCQNNKPRNIRWLDVLNGGHPVMTAEIGP